MNRTEIPEFFVPKANSPEQAERIWQATRTFAEQQLSWTFTERRVYAVKYMHNGGYREAVVGEKHYGNHEVVCAILQAENCWVVCTPNRGVARGMPILIGEPYDVIEFADPAN